jgi:hypothetical protein
MGSTVEHFGARGHLGPQHPVAVVAGRRCEGHLGSLRRRLIGGVACGACWERAIRDDERIVVLFELPREVEPDPAHVDLVAVERACGGERVALTRTERRVAVLTLAARGLTPWQIAKRLSLGHAPAGLLVAAGPDGEVA